MSLTSRIRPEHTARPVTGGAQQLVEQHYVVVFNVAYRTLGRREDAEDIAQQTFARALAHLDELRKPAAARGWLCRIAANLCVDEFRRRQQLNLDMDSDSDGSGLADDDPQITPAVALEQKETRLAVWSAALTLPPQQRLALALREWQEMSYAQIARALDTNVSAVETILFRARQGFRQAYKAGTQPWQPTAACKSVVERLSASVDGELYGAEKARIDAHLSKCATCQFAHRELRSTKRVYALMPLAAPPVAAHFAALMAVPVAVAGLTGVAAGGGLAGGLTVFGVANVGLGTAIAVLGATAVVLTTAQGMMGSSVDVAAAAAAPPIVVQTRTRTPIVEFILPPGVELTPEQVQITATTIPAALVAQPPATANAATHTPVATPLSPPSTPLPPSPTSTPLPPAPTPIPLPPARTPIPRPRPFTSPSALPESAAQQPASASPEPMPSPEAKPANQPDAHVDPPNGHVPGNADPQPHPNSPADPPAKGPEPPQPAPQSAVAPPSTPPGQAGAPATPAAPPAQSNRPVPLSPTETNSAQRPAAPPGPNAAPPGPNAAAPNPNAAPPAPSGPLPGAHPAPPAPPAQPGNNPATGSPSNAHASNPATPHDPKSGSPGGP
jgi:RNA polymerase sigma factor (sigma-70 family)